MADKTVVSFFLDDVGPYATGAVGKEKELTPIDGDALKEFLEFLKAKGLAGAVSVIPGWTDALLTKPKNDHERKFAEAVGAFGDYPVDPHMEIMTHGRLFDFSKMAPFEDGRNEMAWLDDHSVSLDECRDYFLGTIKVGRELGVCYTGLSTPGTHPQMNPNVWEALLDLAQAGELPNEAVPAFVTIEEGPDVFEPRAKVTRGRFAVYDMPSGVWDHIASWRNSPDWNSVDHYLDADGNGHLASIIKAGSPVALFHMHWQGLNPQTGLGWKTFGDMIDRLMSIYGDRIVWARPSEIAARFNQERDA
ncbi:MAG: hypothetical protein SVV80_09130 [Planctomycetota bacterium]|nr:hypothetical protein [Planctomycetota bacterium]